MPSPIEIIEARRCALTRLAWFGPEHLSVPLPWWMGEEDEAGAAELMAALGATPDGTPLPFAVPASKRE